jgi:hypothetical protein
MNAIRNLITGFANLTASVNALAGVIDLTSGRLRQSLALGEAAPALPHSDVLDADKPAPAKRSSRTAKAAV